MRQPLSALRSRNALAAAVAIPIAVALLAGAVVVARSTPSRRETRNVLARYTPTTDRRTCCETTPPTTSTRTAAGPYRPKLDANGDPVFVAPRLPSPRPSSEPLPPALTATNAGGPVVTTTQAGQILDAMWALHSRALETLDTRLMARFETDLALEVDLGRCVCSGLGDPFGVIGQSALFVPRQTTYPARFFAEVDTTASKEGWLAFLVFTRASAGQPWLLAFVGGFPAAPGPLAGPAVDGEGYLQAQTAAPLVDPRTVHTALAEYWRTAKRTGRAPASSIFEPGKWTTIFAQELGKYRQGKVSTNGLVGYYAYETDPANDGVYTFAEGQGYVIVCSAVRMQRTFVGTNGLDGPVQDMRRVNWGPQIAPGLYRGVILTDIAVPCIEVPPAGSKVRAVVLGAETFDDSTQMF